MFTTEHAVDIQYGCNVYSWHDQKTINRPSDVSVTWQNPDVFKNLVPMKNSWTLSHLCTIKLPSTKKFTQSMIHQMIWLL